MTSIVNEYRRRHRSTFVWPVNDGFCFFVKKNRPSLVVTISENSRSLTNCKRCSFDGNLVVEGYILNNPLAICSIKRMFHFHARPNVDLCSIISKHEEGFEALALRNETDADLFLWRMFLQTKPFSCDKDYLKFEQALTDKNLRVKTVEQMLWVAMHRKEIFTYYYDGIYSTLMAGRRYILFR